MTPEPPSRPARRNRPDTAFRQRALGVPPKAPGSSPPGSSPPAASPPASASPPRESLRSALSRIPDLQRDGAEATDGPAARPSPEDAVFDDARPADHEPAVDDDAELVRSSGSPDVARVGIDDTGEARVVAAALVDPV